MDYCQTQSLSKWFGGGFDGAWEGSVYSLFPIWGQIALFN